MGFKIWKGYVVIRSPGNARASEAMKAIMCWIKGECSEYSRQGGTYHGSCKNDVT